MRIASVADGQFPSPIVVVNTAHSGSRLLTRLLIDAGVHMGANLSDTMDCLDMQPVVETAVMSANGGFPSGKELEDEALRALADRQFAALLAGAVPGQRWGWKLCETLLVVPLIQRYFPDATFVHLIRDGRDVAFSPFVAPKAAYWRKVYFGSEKVRDWRGFPMTQRAYRAYGYLFNAARWRYHVDLASAFGAGLGARYIEIRYEDLVERFEETRAALLARLGLPPATAASPVSLRTTSVAKWRREPAYKVSRVLDIVDPTLSAFGYSSAGLPTRCKTANVFERLILGGTI